MEILGNNLKQFFDTIDKPQNDADITYANNKYEVWKVSDKLFIKICDMSEEEFVGIAGEDAWWRQSKGSNLGYPDSTISVNDRNLKCWSRENDCYYSYRSQGKRNDKKEI